jgi:hypothetical protein
MLRTTVSAILFSVMFASGAQARGVTPYLPLNLARDIERDIERVLILGDQAFLTRPIPAATVLQALPAACQRDRATCKRVRAYLQRHMHRLGVTELSAAVHDGDARVVENAHGRFGDSAWSATAQAYWQPSDYALLSVGATAYDGDVVPVGSVLSLGFEYAQLDVGYRQHALSPFSDSAMLLGTQAPTFASVGISNYTPISPLGIRYDFFVGELSNSNNIAFQADDDPEIERVSGKPRVGGVSVSIEPVSGWSLSANRILQYGGGPRNDSTSDLLSAFFRPSARDNASDDLGVNEEFGNQIASFSSRFVFPGSVPFTAYFDYAGEDTSRAQDYLLGNSALSVGLYFPALWNRFDLTYEATEYQNGWYVNGIYGDGLTNEGRILGHWGTEQRLPGDAVGAQAHMLRVGMYDVARGNWEFQYRTLRNEAYTNGNYQRAHQGTVRYTTWFGRYEVGAEFSGGRDVFGDDYTLLTGSLRYGERGPRGIGTAEPAASRRSGSGAEVFIDAGINVSSLTIELGDEQSGIDYKDNLIGAHWAIGARRAVARHHDLGVRVEADDLDGKLLLAVRALDYRYRLGKHLAFSGFAGAVRYDLATPAYGLYGGVGAGWRDLLPNWDLSLDVRFGETIARDKVLANEVPGIRPDNFYDLFGGSLSLSYRW